MSEKSISSLLKGKVGIGIAVIAIIVVGGIAGIFAWNAISPQTDKTEFYVLSFHWGYVMYDENLTEVQNMTVTQGAHVQIHFLGASGLTEELHETFEDRNANNSLKDFDESAVMEAMETAEGNGLLQHGFQINGTYASKGSLVTTDAVANATSVQSLVSQLKDLHKLPTMNFVADKVGSYSIYCTIPCGDFHMNMETENAFIVV